MGSEGLLKDVRKNQPEPEPEPKPEGYRDSQGDRGYRQKSEEDDLILKHLGYCCEKLKYTLTSVEVLGCCGLNVCVPAEILMLKSSCPAKWHKEVGLWE